MSTIDTRTDNRPSTQDFTGKLQQAGEDVKERVSQAASAATDAAKQAFDEIGAAAKDAVIACQRQAPGTGQRRAARRRRLCPALCRKHPRRSEGVQQDTPAAARAIEMAAGYVEDAATKMRNGSLHDLMDGMTSFARRQPAAFLGLSVLAGFAAVALPESLGEQR